MKRFRPWMLACAALSAASPASARAPAQEAGEIRWEPYTTRGADDRPLAGELGRLRVPESRSEPDGSTIEIAFVRFRTSNPEPGPPIFYLVGGPGPSGIEHCVGPATGRFVRLLDHGDVIGIDQRGTGLSRPDLADAPAFTFELPADRPVTRDEHVAAYGDALRRCAAYWKDRGVDLSAYDSVESADDVEAVRAALGIEEILTWGESYGTHLTLAYLRRHAEHVARSVLIRVEGPDHTFKLPSTIQRHLARLHELVAADPGVAGALPDFQGTVRDLLDRLAKTPATVAAQGGERVTVGPYDLQAFLANRLGLAFELVDVPAAVHRMAQDDWSPLAASAWEIRRGEVGSPMPFLVDCASGATPARLRRIAEERADPANLLGDAANVPFPDACAACGAPDLGDAFRAPFECDVPMLIVSGDLDAKTPPENVEEIAVGFSAHAHVVAVNAGHEPIEVLSPEYRGLLSTFLRGEPLESRSIVLPTPRFRPIEPASD